MTAVADVRALTRFDTPTVCNVIELAGLRSRATGYADSRLQACYPNLPSMVGYATTATFRSAMPPQDGQAYGGIEEQLETFANLPGPPIVVFQDLDDPAAAATFGEILCTTYQKFGAVGLVTSGTGRDLQQVEPLKFPCFTTGTMGAHGYCHFPQIGVPVRVCGLVIRPGDLLHGDRNGLTVVPPELVAHLEDGCVAFLEAEAVILDYLRGTDMPKVAEFARASQECQRLFKAIEARLKLAVTART